MVAARGCVAGYRPQSIVDQHEAQFSRHESLAEAMHAPSDAWASSGVARTERAVSRKPVYSACRRSTTTTPPWTSSAFGYTARATTSSLACPQPTMPSVPAIVTFGRRPDASWQCADARGLLGAVRAE